MKKIFKNAYVISAIIVFLIVLFIGIFLRFPFLDALLLAAVIAVVGVGTIWWRKEVW